MSDFGQPAVVPFPKAIQYLADRGLQTAHLDRIGLEIAPASKLNDLGFRWPGLEHGIVWHIKDINGKPSGNVGARVWYTENPFAPDAQIDKPKFITPKGQVPKLYYSALSSWSRLKKSDTVYLCESFLKADVLASQGFYAVGVSGIHGWSYKKSMIPCLYDLSRLGVDIVAFFDSNVYETNPKNMRAIEDLRAEFDVFNGFLRWLPLPPKTPGEEREDWGLDDYYMAKGAEALRELCKPANFRSINSGLRSKMRVFNREVVYIEDIGRIAHEESGSMYTASQAITSRWANVTHFDGDKPISVCRAWLQDELRRSVPRIEYQPGLERVIPGEFYNLWKGWGVEPAEDVDDSIRLLEDWARLALPDEAEREWFLNWLAWPIQNPQGRMSQCCILLGKPGVGKGWIAALLSRIYGRDNCAFIDIEVLGKKFNADYAAKHMVVVEESDAAWKNDSRTLNNRIKDFITQEWRRVEQKGVDAFMVPAVGHLLLQGNDIDVVKLDESDRRVGVLWIEGEEIANNAKFWDSRWLWLEDDGADVAMRWMLNRDLTEFNPYGVPPMTSAKREMITSTRNSMESWVSDFIQHPDSVLTSPLGVDLQDDLIFTAKELLWLYESNADLAFNELRKRDVDRMSRELVRQRAPSANEGAKINIKATKVSRFKMVPTRFFHVTGIGEPDKGWADKIRNRDINKLLYGT